ncbi:MAG: hypothetical protein ISS80_00910 [Candidatus Cloacimonetes bacterium]|nr:hypothetical protein [Candidatus Cloacimonadota bacterium]
MKNFLFVIVSLISAIALFADWSIEQKVFAEDGTAEDYFGESVSISGNYAIVGARFNDDSSGSAYLYQKNGNDWFELDKIKASDSTNVELFGSSVFINGDYLIISSNLDYNNSSGAAYIYYNDGENWNEMDIITASGSPICDQYGCSVGISVDGEYAIVGAYNDDENGYSSGAAYIYQRNGSEWNLQTKIMASDGTFDDWFGYSTFVSGNYLFIGAINDDDNGDDSGSVYIYENNGTNWEYHSKIISSNYSLTDHFGNSISVSGDYLAIGKHCYDQGEAYIFHFDGENWTEEIILLASDGFYGDHFGLSVSMSEDFVVVGAKDSDDVGISSAAYFYERQGSD